MSVSKVSRIPLRTIALQSWRRLRGGTLEPRRTAASVAIGGFVGCLPIYGLQTPLCALMTVPTRLDFMLAWTVMLFANPVTALPLALAEIELGAFICSGARVALPPLHTSLHDLIPYAKFVAVGSLALGALAGAVGGGAGYVVARVLLQRGTRRLPARRGPGPA